jgi:hypothetical protein
MASNTISAAQTVDFVDKGNVESYAARMDVLNKDETPWISTFNKPNGAVNSTPYFFLTRTWDDACATNAQIQGADSPTASANLPAQLSCEAQILDRVVTIGKMQECVLQHTYNSETAEQRMIAANWLKRDLDKSALQGTSAAAATGTAARMSGITEFISTNTCAMSTGGALTTTNITDALHNVVTACGRCPDMCISPPKERQEISRLYTRTVNDNITKVTSGNVSIIATDFGDLKLVWDIHCSATCVALINTDTWDLKYMRGWNWQKKRLAESGHYHKESIAGAFLQICYNERANHLFTQVSTA